MPTFLGALPHFLKRPFKLNKYIYTQRRYIIQSRSDLTKKNCHYLVLIREKIVHQLQKKKKTLKCHKEHKTNIIFFK